MSVPVRDLEIQVLCTSSPIQKVHSHRKLAGRCLQLNRRRTRICNGDDANNGESYDANHDADADADAYGDDDDDDDDDNDDDYGENNSEENGANGHRNNNDDYHCDIDLCANMRL